MVSLNDSLRRRVGDTEQGEYSYRHAPTCDKLPGVVCFRVRGRWQITSRCKLASMHAACSFACIDVHQYLCVQRLSGAATRDLYL
jgi:hypothetical protein